MLEDLKAAKAPAPLALGGDRRPSPTPPPSVAAAHAEPHRPSPIAAWRSPTTCSASSATTAGCTEAYETTRIELERRAGDATAQVDVYEMYWADLSRLSGAIPRILTEFGTLIFRLSRLGRDTVDEGRGFLRGKAKAPPAWRALTFLQTAIDWLFVNVLAQLFFHLLLFGGVLVVLGLAHPSLPEHRLHLGVAIALAVLGALLLLYRRGGSLAIEGCCRRRCWRSRRSRCSSPAPRSRSRAWS